MAEVCKLSTSLVIVSVLLCVALASDNCPHYCTCNTGTVNTDKLEVHCKGNGLTELPQSLPSASTYSLVFSDNNIKTITGRKYLDRTNHLDLGNNEIHSITREAMEQLMYRVRYLYLNDNQLKCLPLRIGDHLHLNEIRIDHNPWNCSCLGLLQQVFHSDFVDIMSNDLQCSQVPPYEPHGHSQGHNENLKPKSSVWQVIERDGFVASFISLVCLSMIVITLIILYTCKHSKDKKKLQLLREQESLNSIEMECFEI